MTKTKKALLAFTVVLFGAALALAIGRRPTSHAVAKASLGTARSTSELLALLEVPGPVTIETVASADWEVERSGLLNLDHPEARAAGLADGAEPIQIYFHALRHEERGLFVVDTGMERAFVEAPERALIRGVVAKAMNGERLVVRQSLGAWLEAEGQPLKGVFLTHLHLDHLTGLPDAPKGTSIFVGPDEVRERSAQNFFVAPILDRALEGHAPLLEWSFAPDPDGVFDGILDVFGDGSVFALLVPGHTPGTTAYLVRTPSHPVLLVGDACHTKWGWEHGVEPGTFSHDRARSARSLATLRRFALDHPSIEVRLGHQPLG